MVEFKEIESTECGLLKSKLLMLGNGLNRMLELKLIKLNVPGPEL